MTAIFYLSPMLQSITAEEPLTGEVVRSVVVEFEAQRPVPGFTEHTPGQLWTSEQGIAVVRRDHRPILLTTEICASCGQRHIDTAHAYTFMTITELYAAQEEAENVGRDPVPARDPG